MQSSAHARSPPRTVTHWLKHRSTSRLYILACVHAHGSGEVLVVVSDGVVFQQGQPVQAVHIHAPTPCPPPPHVSESLTCSSSSVRMNSCRWCGGIFWMGFMAGWLAVPRRGRVVVASASCVCA